MEFIVAGYAAVLSTVVALFQYWQWRAQSGGVLLNITPRTQFAPADHYGHVEVNVQATQYPVIIRGIGFVAHKSWWHWLRGHAPFEVVDNRWKDIFPRTIEPGRGWEGLLTVNDKERAMAARYHIRVQVWHSGPSRIISKPAGKMLCRR